MVTWKELTVDLVGATLFTPEPYNFGTGSAVATILAKFRDRFDGDAQVLPFPVEIPPEVPRIVLQSNDGNWRTTVGPARVDCIWNNKSATPPRSLANVVRECAEVLEHYVQECAARVGRVGLVVLRACPVAHPAEELIKRFCSPQAQKEPFNRSTTFEIHNHKVYTPHQGIDYKVNSWVRCKSETLVPDNRPVILVQQDLNSLIEDTQALRFTVPEIRTFFNMAAKEADEILRKYFPDQESP